MVKDKWDRLIPVGGVEIKRKEGSFQYFDFNDIGDAPPAPSITDLESQVAPNDSRHIAKGKVADRAFKVCAFFNKEFVASYRFWELLDGPHGYGKNHFMLVKVVASKFIGSIEARYVALDLFKVAEDSKLIKKIYAFNKESTTKTTSDFLDDIDIKENICFSLRKEDAGLIKKVKTMNTEKGKFSIYEWNAKK